jgi:hypothetical protein
LYRIGILHRYKKGSENHTDGDPAIAWERLTNNFKHNSRIDKVNMMIKVSAIHASKLEYAVNCRNEMIVDLCWCGIVIDDLKYTTVKVLEGILRPLK